VEPTSVADYCREVEAYLTRVNGGTLIKIVGPAYVLVRSWQEQGIPLSVVMRGIDQKAERHQRGAGARGRTLHISFCADDVQELFEQWKRAVGMMAVGADDGEGESRAGRSEPQLRRNEEPTKKPSLSKHLERVTERLSRLLGRNDLPEAFLERVNHVIGVVAATRESAKGARGPAREEAVEALRPLDRVLVDAARATLTPAESAALEAQAASELAAYRGRLDPAAWEEAVKATAARLVRERFALPVVDPDAS
jgi:hypothetical protein